MPGRYLTGGASATVALAIVTWALGACSSSTTISGPPDLDGGTSSSGSSGSASPCGPNGATGTFHISGTLQGTESICGLALGSFDGGTLTITGTAGSTDAGVTVTVAGSGAGHIDVADCPGAVAGCRVTASCTGATDKSAGVSLDVSITSTSVSGSSQLRYNGCQAPGLSFAGTRTE